MFIVYIQCNECKRKEWATAAERDWVDADTGKPIGRKYRARHGAGRHLCPKCQETVAIEQAIKWQTQIETTDLTVIKSSEGLVLQPVGSHQTNPFTPEPQAQPEPGDLAIEE